jgi:cytochrome c oxidase subunit IV
MSDTHHNDHSAGYDNDQSPYTHPDIHTRHDEAAGVESRKKIWKVFWILLILTVIEFILAYVMPRGFGRNGIYIIMTLVKAFYIVGFFMHLKDEVKSLITTIVVPLTFVVWFIIVLLVEGGFYGLGWFKGL